MRKLFSVCLLACLMAIPPVVGASEEDVPALVAVSRVPSASPPQGVPALRKGPLAFARTGTNRAGSEATRSLISSAVAGDPLDHQEARDRLLAATRDARRSGERGGAEPAPPERPTDASVPPQLEAIAACESGGDPTAIGGGGAYRGKYQFSPATWQAVGGSGDPAAAPEAEQDRRAAVLYAQSGASQWPVCGG